MAKSIPVIECNWKTGYFVRLIERTTFDEPIHAGRLWNFRSNNRISDEAEYFATTKANDESFEWLVVN